MRASTGACEKINRIRRMERMGFGFYAKESGRQFFDRINTINRIGKRQGGRFETRGRGHGNVPLRSGMRWYGGTRTTSCPRLGPAPATFFCGGSFVMPPPCHRNGGSGNAAWARWTIWTKKCGQIVHLSKWASFEIVGSQIDRVRVPAKVRFRPEVPSGTFESSPAIYRRVPAPPVA
jgi:hypothetical protein